jgi:tripartite-type tricarboxylate transporter receptor subunit TctC
MVREQRVSGRMQEASRRGRIARIIVVAIGIITAMPIQAQPVADFYRGKTLRMLIGYGPGGGYDIYGRLVAEFLPRHLPGNPTSNRLRRSHA